MKKEELFKIALGLQEPWYIGRVELKEKGMANELHLYIEHLTGVKFQYEGVYYPVYDHQERTWRHLNFFEHECYLHARVPRVRTQSGQVLLVDVPWACSGSSFTLLFEAYAALLIEGGMPCTKAGDYMGISGKSIWTILRRMISTALTEQPLEDVRHMGVDETSNKKGHDYITVLTDVGRSKVVGISAGKDQEAFVNALSDVIIRGADVEKVELVTMDMSPSYIAGVSNNMPNAEIVFDRFHLEHGMNKVVDEVRREEAKKYKDLKKTRYLWLRNQSRLNQEQTEMLAVLQNSYPKLGEVHRLKEQLKEVLDEAYYTTNLSSMNNWLKIAWESKIDQVQRFVNSIRAHWYGIKTYFEYCVTNGFAERVNLKIQEIKRIAKGYRNQNNFMLMIYFHLGRLNLNLPIKYG